MIYALDFVFALIVAALVFFILTAAIGVGRPTSPRGTYEETGLGGFWLFILLLFGIWAIGIWIEPVGPTLYGGYWLPFLLLGLFFLVLIPALTPPTSTRKPGPAASPAETEAEAEAEAKAAAAATGIGIFFWVLLIVLLIALVVGYALSATVLAA